MTICEKITQRFPVRKTEEQKQAFRQWVRAEIAGMGYSARVTEHDRGHHQNIVIGDPPHAEVTITAHYDTPSTILLPDLQIPRNFPVYLLWQMIIIGLMLLISMAVGAGLGLVTKNGNVMILAFFGAFLVLMLLQLNGFANKNNVNDNTSGVAALLETMKRIPEENRGKVAFILFDNMEKGRGGSKAYARDHVEMQHTGFVVSLDSVGVGEVFLASVPALAKQLPQYAMLEKALSACPDRNVRFCSSLTTRGNSDFRSFKCGVGITAYRQIAGVGLYLGKLHTAADTQADQGNIDRLAEALSVLAKQF
ncbi:MAG: M28 family peptidase [Clostridia bacterium]|nr:M28 family peptidase [Clostridia bacterium]